MPIFARDNHSYRYPVSIKGVVAQGDAVVLLRNARQEWELPGGKIEPNEVPEDCLIREINEELSIAVHAGPLLDTWIYKIAADVIVFVVTYGVDFAGDLSEIKCSSEHKEARVFGLGEVDALSIPDGYKRSIRGWAQQRR